MAGTEARGKTRREKILDAASTHFALNGYHGASTRRIADSAKVSQPYVIRLFGSKEALFIESLRHQAGLFRESDDTAALVAELLLQALLVREPASIPRAARETARVLQHLQTPDSDVDLSTGPIAQLISSAVSSRLTLKADHDPHQP